jgi:diguanylate cyclase (GGDEF)-like protein
MLFKKRNEAPAAASTPAPEREPDFDAALDAVVGIVRSFGENAFDTEAVRAADTRAECEAWARKLALGEQPEGASAGRPKRDFGGARRYLSAHRAHEREYVTSSVTNLREAVHAFARCLTRTVGDDRSADARVGAQLGHLVAAFRSNDPDTIRREAEAVVQVVSDVMDQRRRLQEQQLQLLSEKIRRLKAELHEARESATLDPLTQLHNRASLDAQLERVADLSFLMSATPCLLMIDIDHFKSVNDRFGHPIGDEVIRKVADTLVRNFLRREDFVARYGGEEFVVVVPDSAPQLVQNRAERVRQAIAEIGFRKGEQDFSVTASIGVAVLSAGDTGQSWLARADAALYEAKSAGRNRVIVARDLVHAPSTTVSPSASPARTSSSSSSSGSLRVPSGSLRAPNSSK